jgi:hypothetical protein
VLRLMQVVSEGRLPDTDPHGASLALASLLAPQQALPPTAHLDSLLNGLAALIHRSSPAPGPAGLLHVLSAGNATLPQLQPPAPSAAPPQPARPVPWPAHSASLPMASAAPDAHQFAPLDIPSSSGISTTAPLGTLQGAAQLPTVPARTEHGPSGPQVSAAFTAFHAGGPVTSQ